MALILLKGLPHIYACSVRIPSPPVSCSSFAVLLNCAPELVVSIRGDVSCAHYVCNGNLTDFHQCIADAP